MTVRLAITGLVAAVRGAALAGCAAAPPHGPAPVYTPMSPASLPSPRRCATGTSSSCPARSANVPGKLELVPGGMRAEAAQAMENIRAIVERHGSSMATS